MSQNFIETLKPNCFDLFLQYMLTFQELSDSDESEGSKNKCKIKFQENSRYLCPKFAQFENTDILIQNLQRLSPIDSLGKSKNITIEIYNTVVKEAKLCIEDYVCQLSQNVIESDFEPIRMTKSVSALQLTFPKLSFQ